MERRVSYETRGWLYRVFFDHPDNCCHFQLRYPWFIGCIFLGVGVFGYLLAVGIHHVGAPGSQAEVRQTQQALPVLDVCDVKTRNRLIKLNARVDSRQSYNRIWFFDPAIPDSWDTLETVPIDSANCYQSTERKDINVTGLEGMVKVVNHE